MSKVIPTPQPLYDTRELLDAVHACTKAYLASLAIPEAVAEHKLYAGFLKSYANSNDTFTAYRREVERLLHWGWLICKKPSTMDKYIDIDRVARHQSAKSKPLKPSMEEDQPLEEPT